MHRDTLQFVHDKLVNAPVGVEARENNRIAMARIYARIAECLERHHIRSMASLIRELARRRRRGGVRVRVRVRVVIRAYEQVVLCACAACCWCATMRLVSWMKLSRFADEKLFGCG